MGRWRVAAVAALAFFGAAGTNAQQPPPPQQQSAGPPPLDAYGDLPGIERMALSPSGKNVAAISVIGGRRMLLILDSNMAVQKMLGVENVKVRDLEWAGDDEVVLVRSDLQKLGMGFTTDRFDAWNALVVPVAADGKIKQVFADQQQIAHAIEGGAFIRLVGNQWKGYFGGIELIKTEQDGYVVDNTNPSLFEVDMQSVKPHRVAKPTGDGSWREWLVDDSGKAAASFDIRRLNGDWRIENGDGKSILTGNQKDGEAGLVALGPNGDTAIYTVKDSETGEVKWREIPLHTKGEPKEFLPEAGIDDVLTDHATGRLIGYVKKGENPAPVMLDPAREKTLEKVRRVFPKLNVSLEDWSEDFSVLLVRTSGNGDSGTWHLVDLTKGEAKTIGAERMQIPPSQVGRISIVSYKAQDGLEMDGILTLPPGKDPHNLPIILLPHGGPYAYDPADFDWWAQAFASRGYAVFQPNFRGSTNGDDAFRDAGDGQWGRKMQTDISDGLAELVRQGIADPKPACIMGASYGGYAALAGVTLQQGLYRCAVAVAPVSDPGLMMRRDVQNSGYDLLLLHGLEEELGKHSTLDDVSPRRFASHADAPILLMHGTDDTRVPIEQSRKMAEALKAAGKPYEYVELQNEDHFLSRPETRKQMLATAMAFVQKYDPAS